MYAKEKEKLTDTGFSVFLWKWISTKTYWTVFQDLDGLISDQSTSIQNYPGNQCFTREDLLVFSGLIFTEPVRRSTMQA